MSTATVDGKARPGALKPRRRRGGPTLAQREGRWGYLFAAPAGLHIALWTGLPVIVALVLSLTDYDMLTALEFIGFDNYVTLANDPIFWRA